jgi:hypothetical protein
MKKTLKLIGTILLVTAIVFTLTTCKDGSGNPKPLGEEDDTTGLDAWTLVANSTFGTNEIVCDITYGGGKFVAVGDNGKIAYCKY